MIAVELTYTCDAPGCSTAGVVVSDDAMIAGSDREQYVRVPSDLPRGWVLDNCGNIFCPCHVETYAPR